MKIKLISLWQVALQACVLSLLVMTPVNADETCQSPYMAPAQQS